MEARCYRGGDGRTRMKILKIGTRDYVAASAMIVLLILSIWSRGL
jgi:energy-coupling factor transport system permease protein